MKYIINIFLAIVLSFFAISCDKQVATGNSAVGFKGTEFNFGLGVDLVYVPIEFTGETSKYPVSVKIEVVSDASEDAPVEGKDFIITSLDLVIPSDTANVAVEIRLPNKDIEELKFTLKIVEQNNAQSISNETATIIVKKTDYDRLIGEYIMSGTIRKLNDATDGGSLGNWTIEIKSSIPEEEFIITGFDPYKGVAEEFILEYDKETKRMILPVGSNNAAGPFRFTNGTTGYISLAVYDLVNIVTDKAIPVTYSSDYNELFFDMTSTNGKEGALGLITQDENLSPSEDLWTGNYMRDFTITRIPDGARAAVQTN